MVQGQVALSAQMVGPHVRPELAALQTQACSHVQRHPLRRRGDVHQQSHGGLPSTAPTSAYASISVVTRKPTISLSIG